MQRSDNRIQPTSITLLRNLLREIAEKPRLEHIAPIVLREAKSITGASAGFYLVFAEPRELYLDALGEEQIPSAEWLTKHVSDMSADIHLSTTLPDVFTGTYSGWLVAPVLHKDNAVGVFCLLYESDFSVNDDISEMLAALVDGLTIVTHSTKIVAHHAKLTSNQNEFVRIVSHDLRSPLTSIKGFASMLESNTMGELSDKQLHFVEKILSGVGQMTSLVDNIQDAGRYDPETGFYEMQRAPTDLVMMVKSIVKNHLVPAEKEALTLTVNADPDTPIVNVDSAMIERSVINLVDNAIKYTPNGGTIEVGVRRDNDDIIITVSDNGYGISDENLKRMFQRHFRIRRREHKRVKGSGLGLFIVRSVARHHGGDAFVQSSEGEGSVFGIKIPLEGENLLGSSAAAESD